MSIAVVETSELQNIVEKAFSNFMKNYQKPAPASETGGIELAEELLPFWKKSTIYKRAKKMPHRKMGKKLIFSRTQLLNWIDAGMPDLSQNKAAEDFQKLVRNRIS